MSKQTVKILYHASCSDGFGAAYAAWVFFNNENRQHKYDVTYIPVRYNQPPVYAIDIESKTHIYVNNIELMLKDMVYILDFSYKREDIKRIEEHVSFLLILDHHKTGEAELNGLPYAEFDMNRSGAMMAWEHFNGKYVPRLIQYIQDQDLWQHKLPDSQGVTRWLRSFNMDFNVWAGISVKLEHDIGGVKNEAKAIERCYREYIKSIKHNVRFFVDGNKRKAAIVNCNAMFVSDACHDLITENGLQYAIGWYMDKHNTYLLSLRGNEDTDVSEIAKLFKGGGHKAAAGGQVDNLNELYNKLGVK